MEVVGLGVHQRVHETRRCDPVGGRPDRTVGRCICGSVGGAEWGALDEDVVVSTPVVTAPYPKGVGSVTW